MSNIIEIGLEPTHKADFVLFYIGYVTFLAIETVDQGRAPMLPQNLTLYTSILIPTPLLILGQYLHFLV